MIIDIVKVFLPAVVAFVVGIILTPVLAHFLYKHKMWKKKAGKTALDGSAAIIFNGLHKDKETGTPRMGGIVIWASALLTTLGISLASYAFPNSFTGKLSFLSRNQTWIPLATLVLGALVGLLDDWLEIMGNGELPGGLSLRKRLLIVGAIALGCALWF